MSVVTLHSTIVESLPAVSPRRHAQPYPLRICMVRAKIGCGLWGWRVRSVRRAQILTSLMVPQPCDTLRPQGARTADNYAAHAARKTLPAILQSSEGRTSGVLLPPTIVRQQILGILQKLVKIISRIFRWQSAASLECLLSPLSTCALLRGHLSSHARTLQERKELHLFVRQIL